MRIIYRLACALGIHNWWDAGGGEFVCLECGDSRGAMMVLSCPHCGDFHVLFNMQPRSFLCIRCAGLMEEKASVAEAFDVLARIQLAAQAPQ